jgi:hypothetical protein
VLRFSCLYHANRYNEQWTHRNLSQAERWIRGWFSCLSNCQLPPLAESSPFQGPSLDSLRKINKIDKAKWLLVRIIYLAVVSKKSICIITQRQAALIPNDGLHIGVWSELVQCHHTTKALLEEVLIILQRQCSWKIVNVPARITTLPLSPPFEHSICKRASGLASIALPMMQCSIIKERRHCSSLILNTANMCARLQTGRAHIRSQINQGNEAIYNIRRGGWRPKRFQNRLS